MPADPSMDPALAPEPAGEGDPSDTLARLLQPALAAALPPEAPMRTRAAAVRSRLLPRVAASAQASAALHTRRLRHARTQPLAAGVAERPLYAAPPPAARPLRAGEPLRARLIELEPGARWDGPARALHREWLLLQGEAQVGGARLAYLDYLAEPAGHGGEPVLAGAQGARMLLREAPPLAGASPTLVRHAGAEWPAYAPGIARRVLWRHADDGLAALLYRAEPGASVPWHTHGHDEECLMVEGELFLDDELLLPGDYQLAPAGSGHRVTETERGALIFAHGDLDLRFVG
jgi:quercetin dioxygenase-like cupin family protein